MKQVFMWATDDSAKEWFIMCHVLELIVGLNHIFSSLLSVQPYQYVQFVHERFALLILE